MTTHGATLSTVELGNPRQVVTTLTYAANIAIDAALGNIFKTTTTAVVGNSTLTISGGVAGQRISVEVVNDATLFRTITFSTGFRTIGTLIGTASRVACVNFHHNGTEFVEESRQLLII